MKQGPIRIVGGGVSGLTAAIVLARRGANVEVFERRPARIAHPLRWDAVENWTTHQDFGAQLAGWAIDGTPFRAVTPVEVRAFDGECHALSQRRPLVYAAKRGAESDCLDEVLKCQARELGVTIRHGETLAREQADIWAIGTPRRGFFLDVGITFRTSQPDRVVILVDQRLTPNAFAYLIVIDGLATLAILLTRQFRRARELLTRTLEAFQRIQPFDMHDVHLRSGFGGALSVPGQHVAGPIAVGEAGGYLDYLWGFGIRHAMSTGVLAAHALLDDGDFERLVAREIRPQVRTSLINRKFYDYATNRGYRALIRYFCGRKDLHAVLQRFYQSRRVRSAFWPWVARSFAKDVA